MGSRQLVVAVESTQALGPSWPLLFTEYVEKIIRAFAEESSTQNNASTPGMMAMVSFNSHANRFEALFQQSSWTSRVDVFLGWLNSLNFTGGGSGDVAVAEALAEALWMCCPGPKLPAVTQQRHCLLIAASEPYRISRRVVRPLVLFNAKGQREYQTQEWWSANAEAVSKAFPACQVSLSVIAPRKLASLRSIYNGARRNPRAAESGAEVSNQYPHHLILISEDFSEGKRAISRAADTPVDTNPTPAPSSPASGLEANLLTALGPVTSGSTPAMFTGSGLSTMVGGTLNTLNPAANTNLVSPAGSNQSGLSAPPRQGGAGPIPVSGASLEAQSNPSRVPAVIGGTTSAVAIPGIVQGPVTSGTAGMNVRSGLSTVVANANMNSMANTNLGTPARGLGSNQLGLSAPPLQGIPVSGASQAQSNPSRVPAIIGGTTSAVAIPGIVQGPVTSGTAGMNAGSGLRTVVGGTLNANANMSPVANTNLVTRPGSNQLGLLAPPLQAGVAGPISVSGASQAQSNPFGVATPRVNAGVHAIVNVTPAVASGIVTGMVGGSTLSDTNANMNPTANTNLVNPATRLGSNQFLSTPALQPVPIQVSGPSQAQSNPFGAVSAGVHVAVNVMPPTSGLPQAVQSVPPLGPQAPNINPVVVTQQPSRASNFAKVWEGHLIMQMGQSEILRICKLEAYRRTSASERLAADWLPTIRIVRMITQQNMYREYRGPPEHIMFRLVTQHGFLFQMAQTKMCAVIQLPSQTLLLTSTDKCDVLQGMLFQGHSP